ncbi:TolC family protein [Prevotella communis]|uniref:Outer membrane protein n=1 Tax=Prevotella communis TaxID=2913614 RepID=A0A1H0F6P1_9BACT|nr:TolC family protein [Prevotella communis]UKK56406.1 TolC family protein [Prevotella communis]UKK59160.1 TolC family protein [Prevotella communis]UKK61934.1 TolC family protein [Prevotella communis]UKK64761.1 TolC family protein [Prevotella communis]UKK67129.1 TolC family protein [Prevotella communis]
MKQFINKIKVGTKGMIPLFLFAFIPTHAQKQWTMQECIDYAMQNNITLQKARLSQQSAVEDVKGSKGALLPTVSASANQSLGYRPWQDTGSTTVTNGMVNTKVDKTYLNGSYGVNAQWTVWNGNKNTNNVKLNKLSGQQAELQVAETANSIQERIAQLYVQILYLDESIKVSKASLETSQKNEERGKEMVEVGKMSKADLAQLTAQRASDEYNVVDAQAQMANYKLQLKQLLELTGEEEFDVVIPQTTDDQALAEIPALQNVYQQALLSRPEIESSKLAIESSDLNVKIAKAGWLPSLSLSGSFSTSTNSLSSNGWSNQMKTNFSTQAGLTLSVPLFDGRQTRTSVNKAKIQRQQAQLDLQDQQKTLYQTIEGYWLDANTNQQRFRAAQTTVESEQQSYDLLAEKFNLGLTNIIELMNGKDKLLSAQQNRLQSKYQTILNQQLLRFYSEGRPTPDITK